LRLTTSIKRYDDDDDDVLNLGYNSERGRVKVYRLGGLHYWF